MNKKIQELDEATHRKDVQLSNDHNLVEQLKGTVKNQKGDITLLRDELEKEKKRVQDQW